ncbi:tyrosine-type recombinase/integrase, partial [Gemmatimonadota bacterium]
SESFPRYPSRTPVEGPGFGLARRRGGLEARWAPGRVLTFEEAAEKALELMANRTRERTIRERRRILEADLLPAWGDWAVTDIRRADVADLVNKIASRGSPVMANRTLSMVRALCNAMLDLELVEANPATRPDRFMRDEKPKERALGKGELRAILRAVKDEGPEARAFFGLLAYTIQRAGAIAAAKWDEFDGDTWTIPPEEGRKFKKYARVVPLTTGALRALRVLHEEAGVQGSYLFPSRDAAQKPHWTNWSNLTRRLRARSGVEGWSLHDLRATFRTLATRELGIRADVADAVLGHAISTVGHVHYEADKSTYLLSEKRDALEAWGSFLEGLEDE